MGPQLKKPPPHEIDLWTNLWYVLLIDHWCIRVGSAISGLVVLGLKRKVAEQATRSNPVSSILFCFWYQFLPPGSFPEFLS